jgi:hypothetical protein
MVVFERAGSFLPSKLQGELAAAGVPVLGVTATDDDTGDVIAVQVICDDGADEATVDTVVAAHDPTPPAEAPASPTPTEVAAQMADTIHGAVAAVPDTGTVADLKGAIVDALAPYLSPATA